MKLLGYARWPIIRHGLVVAFEVVALGVAYVTLIPHRRRPI